MSPWLSRRRRRYARNGDPDHRVPRDDTSCSTDSDCTVASLQTACFSTGCGGIVLNQAGAAQLAAAIANINATTCAGYAANHCVAPCCPDCPLSPIPSCVSGMCKD
jgi:hypothetical protein